MTPREEGRAAIERAFQLRLGIYRMKQEHASPFGEDIYTRWDALGYVIEAIELLAKECGIEIPAHITTEGG